MSVLQTSLLNRWRNFMMKFKRIKSSNNHSRHRFILNRRSVLYIYEQYYKHGLVKRLFWLISLLILSFSLWLIPKLWDGDSGVTLGNKFRLLVTQSHKPSCDFYQCESHRRNVKLKTCVNTVSLSIVPVPSWDSKKLVWIKLKKTHSLQKFISELGVMNHTEQLDNNCMTLIWYTIFQVCAYNLVMTHWWRSL